MPQTNKSGAEEHRRHERADVHELVIVKDVMSGDNVGHLVNLSVDGFMLIGRNYLRENCLYQLAFVFENSVDGVDHVSVGAECLWTNETGAGDQHWSGFHIMDVSGKDQKIIASLVDKFSE